MTDVFISYKREEREQARLLAEALTKDGFSVWWDAEILPGEQYRSVTLEILESCHAALVIWSSRSVSSNWVLDEAQRALERGVLIPVMFERINHYPLGFGQVHAHDLTAWKGGAEESPFQPVVAAVRRLTGKAKPAPVEPERSNAEVEAEVAFWRGVHDSNHIGDIETYLARYENGLFADLARRRIESLQEVAPAPKRSPRAKAPRARKQGAAPKQSVAPIVEAPVEQGSSEQAHAATEPEAPLALASLPAPEPRPEPAWGMYRRWELAFIAAIVLLSPFLLSVVVNLVSGAWATKDLFGISNFPDVILLSPPLIGAAWLYDRVAAWCATLETTLQRSAPRIAVGAALALAFLVGLFAAGERTDRVHLVLWIVAGWLAAMSARPAVAWLRQRLPGLDRHATRQS